METVTDTRPTWTWTNDLSRPSSIRVEPAFKDELGLVFVGIGDWDREAGTWTGVKEGGQHRGIWLSRRQIDQLVHAMHAAADWSETHGEDDE